MIVAAAKQRDKSTSERSWRNSEMLKVASQETLWSRAYKVEIEGYLQELADYPDKEGFPDCARPERPLTGKGNAIIL